MQNEWGWRHSFQRGKNRVDVLRAFGQHENLAPSFDGGADIEGNGFCSYRVVGEMTEHVLNTRARWQIDGHRQ